MKRLTSRLSNALVAVPILFLFWPLTVTDALGGWKYGKHPWLVWIGAPCQFVWFASLLLAVLFGLARVMP